MVHQCLECFGIFRRAPGQIFLFEHLCPECEFKRTSQAQAGEVVDIPEPSIPVRVTLRALHVALTNTAEWLPEYDGFMALLKETEPGG